MPRLFTLPLVLIALMFGALDPAQSQPLPKSTTSADVPTIKIPGVDRAIRANVTALDLSRTQVTDAGLKELAGLKQLTTLDLRGAQVTDAGLKELRAALPGCKITR